MKCLQGSISRIPVQASRRMNRQRSLPAFIVQSQFRSRKGSASAYTLPDRSYPVRADTSRLLPLWEREVPFLYFFQGKGNSYKTVRIHFAAERIWKESFAIICMYQRIIFFHTYRFFYGGTRLWRFYRQKT